MTGINSFIASYMLNYREVWNQRLHSLENFLKSMIANEKNVVEAPDKLVYIDTFADSDWNIVSDSELYTTVLFEEKSGGTRVSIVT